MVRFYLSAFFFVIIQQLSAQGLHIDSTCKLIATKGDDLFPKWSADGSQLLFQSNRDGNWDVFTFNFYADTLFQLSDATTNEQHPVWHPNGQFIVFDSDHSGALHLYKKDLITGEESILFRRDIQSQQASFPPTQRLVYFSGYDKLTEEWAIYSYDFVSDNLNELTDFKGNCFFPIVSTNGKQLLVQRSTKVFPYKYMVLLNWYGNLETEMDILQATDASWGADGLKIYFVSTLNELNGEVYSMWKDGSHIERLTNDKSKVRTPAISPDGSRIALSVLWEDQYDIFIIPIEQY